MMSKSSDMTSWLDTYIEEEVDEVRAGFDLSAHRAQELDFLVFRWRGFRLPTHADQALQGQHVDIMTLIITT